MTKQSTERLTTILASVNICYNKMMSIINNGDLKELLACKYYLTKGTFEYWSNKIGTIQNNQSRSFYINKAFKAKDELIRITELKEKIDLPELNIRIQ